MKKQVLLALSISVFAVSAVFAQTMPTKTISGGEVNGKAEVLPAPVVPAAAKAVKACGSVNVQVLIDEQGNIAEANAVSGHPLLRGAAETAARGSQFKPTMLSGQSVKVSGIIVYKFACDSGDANSTSNESADKNGGIRAIGNSVRVAPNSNNSIKTMGGGVVNGKAISLPRPKYPAAAQAVKASGAVNVQILIDETGNVIEANAVTGHPLLRQLAEQAARGATFAPTMLSGQPVKVSGVIVYNFGDSNVNAEGSGAGADGFPVRKSADGKDRFFGLGMAFSMMNEKSFPGNRNLQPLTKSLATEFPQFTEDLKLLESLDENATQSEKTALLDSSFSSVRGKLSQTEAWQFDTGRQLGKIMTSLKTPQAKENFDETALRTELLKLRDLTFTAPSDVSADMLENIKTIADFADDQNLNEPANKFKMLKAFMEVLKAVSP